MVKAIVLSGGSGKRMGGDTPKQYLPIKGKMAIVYALESFEASKADELILVCAEGYESFCRELIMENHITKCKTVITGGAERYLSVYEGLKACGDCDYVLIHDGARICIDTDTINMAIEKVRELKACVVGVKAVDTMQIADDSGRIISTPDRKSLWTAQTPQCFDYDTCFMAYKRAIEVGDTSITDDAMVVRAYSDTPVYMVEGKATNIKLTAPSDIRIIESVIDDSRK